MTEISQPPQSQVNLLATLRPKPEAVSRLEDVLLTLSKEVKRCEPGCLSYEVWTYKTKESETAFVLFETWTSKEALELHHEQPHLRKADKIIADEELLAEEEEDRFLTYAGGFLSR